MASVRKVKPGFSVPQCAERELASSSTKQVLQHK